MARNHDRLMLELRRSRGPAAVLVALAALTAVFAVGIFRNQTFQRPWEEYVDLRVAFTDVKGVVPGKHEVRVAGVPAGIVESSKLENGRPVLRLAIRKEFTPIYRDARIRLRPVTPLQDMFVAIEDRGSRAAGVARHGELLTRAQAASPVDISRVLQVFDADTRVHLHALLDGLGRGLGDRGEDLRQAFAEFVPFLDGVRRLDGAVADRRRELARLVHDMNVITSALAVRDRQLAGLVHRGNQATAALADNDDTFRAALAELPGTVDALRRSMATVRDTEDDLDPALVALRPVADRLESGLRSLQRFADDARPALNALRRPVAALEPTALALDPALRSLRGAVRELTPQAPQVDRITRSFVPCRTAAQKFFNWTLSVFKFSDSFGAFPRGDMTVGANTGTADFVDDPGLRRTPNCMEGEDR